MNCLRNEEEIYIKKNRTPVMLQLFPKTNKQSSFMINIQLYNLNKKKYFK